MEVESPFSMAKEEEDQTVTAGRGNEEEEQKSEEEQFGPLALGILKRKRSAINDGDDDETSGEEYRQLTSGTRVCEEEAASLAPVASSSAFALPSASGSAMTAAARADGRATLLKPEDVAAHPDVRALIFKMRDDVVDHMEHGWNWKIDEAKRKVREMCKEAEHQARLEAAPKRDRPERRPAAAAASRRLMQQAQEEQEVSSRS
jgi:hypothetical protein